MNEDKTVKRITVEYESGETRTIEKGLLARYKDDDGETATVTFDMVGVAGKDLLMVVMSMVQLGERLGFFKDGPEEDTEE